MTTPELVAMLILLALAILVILPALWKDHEACQPLCVKCNREPGYVDIDGIKLCVKCAETWSVQ